MTSTEQEAHIRRALPHEAEDPNSFLQSIINPNSITLPGLSRKYFPAHRDTVLI